MHVSFLFSNRFQFICLIHLKTRVIFDLRALSSFSSLFWVVSFTHIDHDFHKKETIWYQIKDDRLLLT